MNVSIKTKIHYQGKEYSSTDELPPEARAAYQKVLTDASDGTLNQGVPTRLIINAQQFSWPGNIPEAQKKLFEDVMQVVKDAERLPPATIEKSVVIDSTGIALEAAQRRRLVFIIAGLVVLAILMVVLRIATE